MTDSDKVLVYSTKPFDETAFCNINSKLHQSNRLKIKFTSKPLNLETASLANDFKAISVFARDNVNADVLAILSSVGVKTIAVRCAGSGNVDLKAAKSLGINVFNVPVYSPHAIAEFAIALLLAVVRKIPQSCYKTKNFNFAIESFVGFDLYGKTVGLIGLGIVGRQLITILNGFGCKVIAFDAVGDVEMENELNFTYCTLEDVFKQSRVLILLLPLNQQSSKIINSKSIASMPDKSVIINISRGGLIDTEALIDALISGKLSGVGLDVFENGIEYLFNDWTGKRIPDKNLMRLTRMHNVVITSYQSFLTEQALTNIADITISNIQSALSNQPNLNNLTI